MNDARTDQELVAAVRAGDEAAFASLFDRWADRSYDVARRILHDDGRAAEVTQEVFTMAWQQLDTLRDSAAFGGWILRSSRNAALNRRRHEQRSVATDDSDPILRDLDSGRSVEVEAAALGHQDLVWAASAALGERDASILDLHLRHDLSIPEIAEELGVTTNNAHQLVHRMKERLATGIRAYVLVRGGDATCPALRASLADADVSRFGPDAVKVIGAHLKRCEDCDGRQAAVLAPEAMFAAVPILVMAPLVRAQVAAGLTGAGVPAGGASGTSAAGQGATGAGGAPPLGAASPIGSGAVGGAIGGDGAGGGADISPEPPAAGGVPRGPGSRALAIGAAAVVVLIVLAAVLLLRNDSDSSEDASSGTSTTVVAGGDDPEPTTTTEPPTRATTTVPSGGDLEGSWTADAADILGANTANVGGPGGLACSGPITMTFTAEGTFSRSGSVTCSIGSTSASGAVASAGGYAVSGDQLSITGTESTGTMSMGATEIPTPDAFGDGDATYEVQGSTLTITFTDPSVGTVTQTYQRS